MAIVKFGNTWWGQEWLNSFNNIYDSNRLPRGQRYARNGSVLDNILSPGLIEARVQGSMPRPYRIKITLPLLSEPEKQTIINTIEANPYYLGQLLSAKLPPALNNDLLNRGVQLFPREWKDFSGRCSCPDYANPCKHVAAIIYQIANRVDLNPFVIFGLKGFDLLARINQLYGNTTLVQRDIVGHKELNQEFDNNLIAKFPAEQIDFSKVANNRSRVLDLLPQKPLFCLTTDYHQILSRHYKDLTKTAVTVFSPNYNESEINPNIFIIDPIRINPDLSYDINLYDHNQTRKINTLEGLIEFIKEIPNLSLNSNSKELNALYLTFHLTKALVLSSSIVPQLYEATGQYMIRYQPLMQDEMVNDLVYNIAALFPDKLVVFTKRGSKLNKLDQCLWLIAIFIKYLGTLSTLHYETLGVGKITSKALQKTKSPDLEKINLLFLNNPIAAGKHDSEIIRHIDLWLSRFQQVKNNYKSLLQVKEHKDQFKLELLFKDITQSAKAPVPLKEMLLDKDATRDILHHANLITEYIPELASIFTNNSAISYAEEEFLPLFFNILPVVKLIGVEVLLPKALKALILPKLSIKVDTAKTSASISYLNLEEILSFDWQISLGNHNVSAAEFKELLQNGKKLVKIKDQYVYLDEKLIDGILASLDKPVTTASGAGLLRDLFIEDSITAPFIVTPEVKAIIAEIIQNENVPKPDNLLAQLRDYQYQGYCWLYKNVKLGFGSIIADDMGLGKTLQVISCILKLKQDNLITQALVVVPTSLLTNWQKEISRFAPELSVRIHHGASRKKSATTEDITLITYGTIRRDIEFINKHKWDLLVIDEAQNIKNLTTQQTKLIKSIKAKYRIAMSGTPVENRLLEYYSIMDFANKGYLGSVKQFNKQFADPIEGNRDIEQLNKFLLATKPFVLRRLKSDKSIIQDLPDKIVIDEYCDLSKEQVALYQATLDNIMRKLKEEPDEIARRGLVLTLILALKQVCNHPGQYLKQFDNVKVEDSGKLMLLLDKLKDIYANNEKVLIFTQFTEMGEILQQTIEQECNTPVLFLHGGISRSKRDEMVDLIQNNPHYQTMVLSIKAGGVGLNLTGANHVIHYDLWWNPAVENQATDRAYRIGQNKNVFVHRLICNNSFEEKINQMIKNKQELANLTVATGEQWIGNLSDKELQQVFTLSQ